MSFEHDSIESYQKSNVKVAKTSDKSKFAKKFNELPVMSEIIWLNVWRQNGTHAISTSKICYTIISHRRRNEVCKQKRLSSLR